MNHLPKIVVDTIPHKKQRYNTCGDYFNKHGETHFRISKMNPNHEFLVLLHELIEWYLITKNGVTIKEIDDFDMSFKGDGEPGDDVNAPYFYEHRFATLIERMVANHLGIKWDEYDKHVQSL